MWTRFSRVRSSAKTGTGAAAKSGVKNRVNKIVCHDFIVKRLPDTAFHLFYKLVHAGLIAFSFVFRPAVRGVNVVLRQGQHFLLVKNSYRKRLSFPGGYVKSGESPKDAAVREVAEEMGLAISPNQLKHARQYRLAVHFKRETIDIYEMEIGRKTTFTIDNREVVWAGFMTTETALANVLCAPAKYYLEDLAEQKP